jgi:hypothetical protein
MTGGSVTETSREFPWPTKAIPTQHTFFKRLSCSQKHPGLCFSKDVQIYEETLLLASNLERYLLKEHVGQYFRLRDLEKQDTLCKVGNITNG